VLRSILAECSNPTEATQRLLAAASSAELADGTAEEAWLTELGRRLLCA
jgi:hypothetical protein